MGQPLRILIVEDSEEDCDLLLRALRRGGYEPVWQRVDSAAAMNSALEAGAWDLVVSDYVMPGFGGLEALALFHAKGLDLPFIIVSGHIGEDIAVAAMQAGADDYLMKDRLGRLVPAIESALKEADIRRAHHRANKALRENEERFRQLAENIGAVFFMFERPNGKSPGTLSYVSPAYERIWGYPCEGLFTNGDSWLSVIHNDDRERVMEGLPQIAQGSFSGEFRIVRMDGKVRWIQYRTFPVRNEAGEIYRVAAIGEDITERKLVEEQLAANACQLRTTVEELRIIDEELRNRNRELSEAREELENRVQQRTAALSAANSELQHQMHERKRLESELLEIAENERRRIGFDLHDDIGQKLMGVSLLLKAMEKNFGTKRMAAAEDTRKVLGLVDQVINHTHDLAHCFSSLDLQGADLDQLMKKLVANVQRTFRIACRFRTAGVLPELTAEVATQIYKIAQESISNAIKHAKAKKVFISLTRQKSDLILRIKNDGIPFPLKQEPSRRMGLRIMEYRARTMGGILTITPNGNSGAIVTCKLPCINGSTGTPSPQGSTNNGQRMAAARPAKSRTLMSAQAA